MTNIVLSSPLAYGKDSLGEISLREPLAGDLRGIKLRDVFDLDPAALSILLPRIASPALTSAHINQMSLPDMMAIFAKVVDFFQQPQTDFPTTSAADGA